MLSNKYFLTDTNLILSAQNKYTADPKYQHMNKTLRILGYIFTHHLDIWIHLAKQLEQVYLTDKKSINAGAIFKSFLLIDTTNLLNESVFDQIINT
jgi:hypothetical protein